VADATLMNLSRGRRKTKRLRNDIDKMQCGRKANRMDNFLYDSAQNHCSKCKKPGHKGPTCPFTSKPNRGRAPGGAVRGRTGRARQSLKFPSCNVRQG
jgi:hypothetical protein